MNSIKPKGKKNRLQRSSNSESNNKVVRSGYGGKSEVSFVSSARKVGPLRPGLLVCRHGEREDLADSKGWSEALHKSDRPWDPNLTKKGCHQATLLGRSLTPERLKSMGLLPVTRILTSPLIRTIQTAVSTADGMTIRPPVAIENGLSELMTIDWYKSWALSHSDGSWGGPRGMDNRIFSDTHLHPSSVLPASNLPRTPDQLKHMYGVEKSYTGIPFPSADVHNVESRRFSVARVLTAISAATSLFPNETILLVTHAGICNTIYRELSGESSVHNPYTALYAYQKNEENSEKWDVVTKSDVSHLG